MGTISNYLENQLLDHVLETGEYSVPTIYVALSTADPQDDASGLSEPSSNYARKAYAVWNVASSRAVSNSGAISFVAATSSWGTITHYALFDALSGGYMLAHGSLDTSKVIGAGNTAIIADGEIDVSFASGAIFTFLADNLLDHVFGNGAWPATYGNLDVHVGLTTSVPTDSGNINEPSGSGYARVDYANWSTASGGSSSNSGAIAFPTPSGSWGECVHAFLVDGAAGTDYLCYGAVSAQTPDTDDVVQFPIGTLTITLD